MRLSRKAFQDWGKAGGRTRTKKLSPARRKEIARKAARARWQKKGKKS